MDMAVTVSMEITENCLQQIAVVIEDTGSVAVAAVDVVGGAADAVGKLHAHRLDYGFDFEVEDTAGYYALAFAEASEDDVDQKNSDLLKKPSD